MKQIWLSASLGIVLAGVLAWQLTGVPAAPAPAATAAPTGQAPEAPATDEAEANRKMLSHAAAEALARPLFSPIRRPDAERRSIAAVAAPGGLPRLAGIIVAPGGRRALFVDSNSKIRSVAEGEIMGKFTIQRIQPGSVVLSDSDGERVIRTAYARSTDLEAPGR
jgi:hypothetical protein